MLNVFTLPLIYFFLFTFLFQLCIRSRGCLGCNGVWFPCNFLFLMWLSLQMLCPFIAPFIFRVLGFQSPVMAPSLVLCVRYILPCKKSRLLHLCCIKWPFGYLIRWLPYIWTILLLKLIYVIMVIQFIFFFQDQSAAFWIWLKAWYYSYYIIHTYPSQCGS